MKRLVFLMAVMSVIALVVFENTLLAQKGAIEEVEAMDELEIAPIKRPGYGPGPNAGDMGPMKKRNFKGPGVGPNMWQDKKRDINSQEIMEIIKKNDPAFADRLLELEKKDPFKYHQVIKISFRLLNISRKAGEENIEKDIVRAVSLEYDVRELALQYDKATDSEKSKIKEEMKSKLNELFDIRLKAQEIRVKKVEQELIELKSNIQKRKANKLKIVEDRLNQLTKGKDLSW